MMRRLQDARSCIESHGWSDMTGGDFSNDACCAHSVTEIGRSQVPVSALVASHASSKLLAQHQHCLPSVAAGKVRQGLRAHTHPAGCVMSALHESLWSYDVAECEAGVRVARAGRQDTIPSACRRFFGEGMLRLSCRCLMQKSRPLLIR